MVLEKRFRSGAKRGRNRKGRVCHCSPEMKISCCIFRGIYRIKQYKSNGYTVLHKKNKLQVDGSHRLRFDAIRLQQLNL